jgi:hypothetical protein
MSDTTRMPSRDWSQFPEWDARCRAIDALVEEYKDYRARGVIPSESIIVRAERLVRPELLLPDPA